MIGQELTSKESLFMILDLMDNLNIRYWVDGGWGVDVLIGEQTRDHRDVDIDFDAAFEAILIDKLEELGYQITTDWRPARVELSHPTLGYIDIHPLIISDSGEAKQADLEGGWYHFKAEYFSESLFEGRTIPCISLEAQRIFHSGYELREVDKVDLKRLDEMDKSKLIQEKIQINNIPAILYGSASDKLYLYVHGKQSKKEEAEHFANIAQKSGYQVLSFDLPEHGERTFEQYPCTVQNGVHDLNDVYSFVKDKYNSISLYACSIGVYFSLLAYRDIKFEKCIFLSPILDMERLIQNMMKWSNTSEEDLKEKGEHETSFGETLSWDYYEYVRNNPVKKWNSPTFILYGENDNLTERCVLDSFSEKYHCIVDIMPVGEHYFHTKEQLDYLENWLEKRFEKVYIEKGTINDISELEALYDDLNDYLSANINYPGWIKGIYPIRETAEKAIEEGSLYVLRKENIIAGSIILNHEPETAYDNVKWGIDTSYNEILVLRTLVVHPRFMKQGIAKQLMAFAKELAVSSGMKALRLDVSVDNIPAVKLYEQSGYTYVGTVDLGLPYDHLKWFKLYELIIE